MKKNRLHILSIFTIALFSFLTLSIFSSYNSNIPNSDFFWAQSIQYGYSNIFKQYFLDFFNSFYLYNVELGYDHSYYFFSHLNPFYFLSFFGLQDYSIRISNLFAFLSATFFLLKIAKIIDLDWTKTYLLVLFSTSFVSLYGYAFHTVAFNGNMFILLYVLFFFDLKNCSVNYLFYVFYFIIASLTSAFYLIFYIGIVFLIVIFFYKYNKTHKVDLVFFFISNIIIWSIATAPFFLATTELANINIKDIFLHLDWDKNIIDGDKNIINEIFDLFRHNKYFPIISKLEELGQFSLINSVWIGSGIFLYTPIGLLIFTIINYQPRNKYFEITFISIFVFIIATLLLNSKFMYEVAGIRMFRGHLNFYTLTIMIFIYLNLFVNLKNNNESYFIGKNNFNRNLLLFPALIVDLFLITSKSLFPYLFILFLYFPFLTIFFKNNEKKLFLIILLFLVIQPIVNISLYKFQYYKSFKKYDLDQYNSFISCFKRKSDYDKYDRVLATGTGKQIRNTHPIKAMLLERERGTDINILYQYREQIHPKLFEAYDKLLEYKYFGIELYPPTFYNTKLSKYYFDESFFDQLGINSVMVFNDEEKKFQSKYKSFSYVSSCQTKLYKADIYKSQKPRGPALFLDNKGKAIKLNNLSKNSWDLSKINGFKTGTVVLTFAEYLKTKIFIDNTEVKYKIKEGKFLIPYKSGKVLKIIYQNDYHRLIFILVILEYLILLLILSNFIRKIFFRKFLSYD